MPPTAYAPSVANAEARIIETAKVPVRGPVRPQRNRWENQAPTDDALLRHARSALGARCEHIRVRPDRDRHVPRRIHLDWMLIGRYLLQN